MFKSFISLTDNQVLNCQEVEFEDKIWTANLATSYTLVCDRSQLKSLPNYAWFFGVFLNSFTAQAPDFFGRWKVVFFGQALLVISTFMCALTTSIYSYSVFRVFHGVFVGKAKATSHIRIRCSRKFLANKVMTYNAYYTYYIESLSPKQRVRLGLLSDVFTGLCPLLYSVIGYYYRYFAYSDFKEHKF